MAGTTIGCGAVGAGADRAQQPAACKNKRRSKNPEVGHCGLGW